MTTCAIKRAGLVLFVFLYLNPSLWAATPDVSITPEPVQYSFVTGDSEKFSAHHWMKDHYIGGVKDVSLEYEDPTHNITVSSEGHALIDNNDLEGNIFIQKKDWGYLKFDYVEFRKYYDGTGGVYRRFVNLRSIELDKELGLDLGHFSVETGITLEKMPEITFLYEREFKDGAKSRLTWTAIREGAVTRNIGPSWQDIDEIVDTFALKANHTVKGFFLHGEQRWEFVRSEMSREERSFSTTATAADKKIRVQNQSPEADFMTTTLGVERWFWKEKLFASSGYRFTHLDNREVEEILEMNENRVLQNFTNPKRVRNARADNDYDSHTWVGSVMVLPVTWFNVITRFKAEALRREGNSTYPQDTTLGTPDGIINTTEQSDNESKAMRWGEGISLRFTRIPRTALYTELELEQIRNWLSEDRKSIAGQSASNANEVFSRETITHSMRGAWTLGVQTNPVSILNLTAQVRHRRNNNDYDDTRETNPGANTARSAFVDWQNIQSNEFTTRATLRLKKWIEPSFRYQFRDDNYFSRFEAEPNRIKTDVTSHIYTFDVVIQPLVDLLMTASFSMQDALTETPARDSSQANTPAFEADVATWLFSGDYALNEKVALTGTLQYSRADNFNDFSEVGLPMGVDNRVFDLTMGVRWSPTERISVEPKYGFYHYRTNPDVEYSGYNAHVIWLDVTIGLA